MDISTKDLIKRLISHFGLWTYYLCEYAKTCEELEKETFIPQQEYLQGQKDHYTYCVTGYFPKETIDPKMYELQKRLHQEGGDKWNEIYKGLKDLYSEITEVVNNPARGEAERLFMDMVHFEYEASKKYNI